MILHPVIPDILQRREHLADAIRKGHLTPEISRYAQPGWAYILKQEGNPSLAYPSIGNFAGEDEEAGAISYVVTTDEEDRDGDIVRPSGAHLKNYSLNPIVFFGHQEKPIPIGVCRSPDGRITVYPEENRMVDTIYFDLHDPDAALIHDKCRRKILNATSIAFVPIEAWRRDDVRKARTHGDQSQSPPGWYFNQWDKTEVSIVGVPSNPKAVGLEKQLQEACRDVWDLEQGEMSPRLRKAWQPYVAQAKGCWGGWCPLPGDEKDIGGGVVLKAVEKGEESVEKSVTMEVKISGDLNDVGTYRIEDDGNVTHVSGNPAPLLVESLKAIRAKLEAAKDSRAENVKASIERLESQQVKAIKQSCSCDDCQEGRPCPCGESAEKAGEYRPFQTNQVYGFNWNADKTGNSLDIDSFEDADKAKVDQERSRKVSQGFTCSPVELRYKPKKSAEETEMKAQPSDDISPDKACEILRDGTINGKPLTDEQRGMFGVACARASKSYGGLRETCKALVKKTAPTKESILSLLAAGPRGAGRIAQELGADKIDVLRLLFEMELRREGVRQISTADSGTFERTKSATQADLDSPGIPGRNANPSGMAGQEKTEEETAVQEKRKPARRKAALSQADGRIGGYTVPPGSVQSDAKQEPLDDPQPSGWAVCESCHGDGNCEACGGTGTFAGDDECPECGGSGECGACAGEGHVEKSVRRKSLDFLKDPDYQEAYRIINDPNSEGRNGALKPGPGAKWDQLVARLAAKYKVDKFEIWDAATSGKKSLKRKQLDPPAEESAGPTAPQVLAALYSHAKAEAAYLDQLDDQLDDQYKDTLADYRRQQVEERMDMLKYQFSRAAGPDDDIEKLCKAFDDEHDKALESTGPEQTVEPGEAGLVEQGQVPPEEEQLTEKQRRKGRTMKQNTVPAEGAYAEDDPEVAAELDSGSAPFNKAAPGTEEWAEEEATEPEHKASYSNEDFDRAQALARKLTEEDRRAGRPAPAAGYSQERFDEAMAKIRSGEKAANNEEAIVDKEDDEAEEKADNGICMCGMEVPGDATECPGCGAPVNKAPAESAALPEPFAGEETPEEEALENKQEELPVETMAVDEEPVEMKDEDANAVTDPAAEEILERYQNPKSLKWSTRKHRVSKALLPFLKFRKAANGRKYLVRSKQADTEEEKRKAEETLDNSEVKALTTKLAGAIDDLKALVMAKDLPRQYKAGLKHVADTIWTVGKALTDKGKEQKNGGKGSELTDAGKEQKTGGKGSELKDKGEQQGKTPTKSAKPRPVSPAVQQKLEETMAKLKRFGILNGTH